jgi:diaminohydroxyphosphoribosylaminopyrimidine deaminase / 5-amino-6-(5-phosphoribosylamino)uracil reductase
VHQVLAPGTASRALPLNASQAWTLLLALAARARRQPVCTPSGFALDDAGTWQTVPAAEALLMLEPSALAVEGALQSEARALLELMLPLVVGARATSTVVGHLGQSLDGRVATPTGASQFITGREDVVHTHRLRALFDAVVVGVRTVQLDDPQLTTRHVAGAHPTRVVLDPQAKLAGPFKLLDDAASTTLVCTSLERTPTPQSRGSVVWLGVPCRAGRFDLAALRRALAERGLSRLFIEGGGETVSRFLAAGMLDRLHVSVAPLILGSGAPAFALPPIDRLDEALRLRCRHFSLGPDILFDCALQPPAEPPAR